MVNWWTLIKERFSPLAYLPMILVFTAVNGVYGVLITQNSWDWKRFSLTFLIMLSFFFRMRLFDEIKDYEVDLQINPTRPLARGLLSIADVKKMIAALLFFEVLVAGFLGPACLFVHFIAIGYSLLMYEEFFIGSFLRPKLTTYALTHTLVSSLLGFSCAVAMSGYNPLQFPRAAYFFFLMNWAFFNLFEFARKTFAPNEERENNPSYSKIFGIPGAVALSLLQAIIGAGIFFYQYPSLWPLTALLIYVFSSLPFLFTPNEKYARLFRGASGLYLIAHYSILFIIMGV